MHPLNSNNFGVNGIEISFYNGSSVVNGYITRQTGVSRFKVTDGTHAATVSLAPTTAIAADLSANPSYCTILAYPENSGASGATFTVHYGANAATVVSSPSNFNVGDSLALPSGAGALTVATLSGSEIATVTIGTAGSYTSLFTNPVTGTRAAGTGATFTAHYAVYSAVVVGGGPSSAAGYTLNDVLTLTGTGSATVHVDSVDGGGGILTYHVVAVGTVTSLPSNPVATTGGTGTGATFTLTWDLLSVSSSGGSGYNVGDTLIFHSMTATTLPTATITTATSHAATAVTVNTAGQGITVAATSITANTTTATFDVTYTVVSVSSSGGTGYAVDDLLIFAGLVAAPDSFPSAYISTATSGAATAVTVSSGGSGISTAASSVTVSDGGEYVRAIYYNRIVTTEGNEYFWSLGESVNGSALIPTYST